jgi:hypothetical protein
MYSQQRQQQQLHQNKPVEVSKCSDDSSSDFTLSRESSASGASSAGHGTRAEGGYFYLLQTIRRCSHQSPTTRFRLLTLIGKILRTLISSYSKPCWIFAISCWYMRRRSWICDLSFKPDTKRQSVITRT